MIFKLCEQRKLGTRLCNTAPYPACKNYVPWRKKLSVGYLFVLYLYYILLKVK
jgi:hypothetical protein